MLDKLLKSKSMQNIMLGQFKKVVKEEGIKHIVITANESGEFTIEYHKEEIKVLTLESYNNIQQQLINIL